MQRIVVDKYPCKAEDCPFAELKIIENEYGIFERHKCKCSGDLCVISETRFDSLSPDEDTDAYTELAEEYGYNRQYYCREHCRYLRTFDSIFEDRISKYNCQKFKDTKSYW